jgi:hypothetical protein
MGNCTKCGRPNEYVDGPYLCYQCKLFTEVFCGEQAPVKASEPEIRHETLTRLPRISPWHRMSREERDRAADKYRGDDCLNCGRPWGDHRLNDWHCPDSETLEGFSDNEWFAEIPF